MSANSHIGALVPAPSDMTGDARTMSVPLPKTAWVGTRSQPEHWARSRCFQDSSVGRSHPWSSDRVADAGSRQTNRRRRATFTNLTVGWTNNRADASTENLQQLLRRLQSESLAPNFRRLKYECGVNGGDVVNKHIYRYRYPDHRTNTLTSSSSSLSHVGPVLPPPTQKHPPRVVQDQLCGLVSSGVLRLKCTTLQPTHPGCARNATDVAPIRLAGFSHTSHVMAITFQSRLHSIPRPRYLRQRSWVSSSCSVDRSTSRSMGRSNGS